MSNTPVIISIECSGSPREMGRQYGEQAMEAIRTNIEVFGKSWNRVQVDEHERITRRLLTNNLPDIFKELEGIAEGSRVPVRDILMMNQMNTHEKWRHEECTPLAVRNSDVGPILGKNNDGKLKATYSYVIRKTRPTHGISMMQVTYAGWLSGLDAMNAEGLVNGHGAVGSIFDKCWPRLDIRLWLYHLMRTCRTTMELIQKMMDASLTGKGFSIIALDAAGHSSVIEAAIPLIVIRDRDRPFVYSTNLYMSDTLKNADTRDPVDKQIAIYRDGYLRWVEQTKLPTSLDDIKRLLSSHAPWAPCRHGGPHLLQTEWSIIGLPARRTLLVSHGAPCTAKYQEVTIA